MPMWPVHTWLPDAHVEAPTAGSVILAAILLKMAGYGFLRFSVPMFPLASEYFTPLIYTLSIIAIIYTSLVALMQEDMKKLIAYSSVAHMGYVTLGIFTFTKQGIEGSIYQMISHGLISAALFLCVGVVYDRLHSRMISTYGGIVNYLPKYSFLFIVFALAALGLPGTSGFLGEFLVLTGAFQKSYLVAMLATFGVVLGAAYMLWLTKRVIFGVTKNDQIKNLKDVNYPNRWGIMVAFLPDLKYHITSFIWYFSFLVLFLLLFEQIKTIKLSNLKNEIQIGSNVLIFYPILSIFLGINYFFVSFLFPARKENRVFDFQTPHSDLFE